MSFHVIHHGHAAVTGHIANVTIAGTVVGRCAVAAAVFCIAVLAPCAGVTGVARCTRMASQDFAEGYAHVHANDTTVARRSANHCGASAVRHPTKGRMRRLKNGQPRVQ